MEQEQQAGKRSGEELKKVFRTLAFSSFFLYFGFNVWRAVFNNFAVEELGVTATQIGVLQSVREIPGLMAFLIGFLVLWISEMRLIGISVLLMGLGIVIGGLSSGVGVLMVGALVMSIGFHVFYPSSSSVVLMGVGKDQTPRWLGRLGSVSAFAAVVGTLVVWFMVDGVQLGSITIPAWGYRTTLYVTGGVVLFGSLFAMRNGRR
jgi:MFS family permease